MVLDHESCFVSGCTFHQERLKTTSTTDRNAQIREDWKTGSWTVEELSYFWNLNPRLIQSTIAKGNHVKD